MENTLCIFYCCVVIPLLFAVILTEKKSRKYIISLVVGITCCLVASCVNSAIQSAAHESYIVLTTTYTPISEEILKAIPVLYYAMFFSNDERELIGIGFATGVGFAILENASVLLLGSSSVTIMWALLRAFSTSLMHGMTTALLGFGMALIRKRKKLFVTGTFSFLTLAIIYHAIFNVFVQSELQWIAISFPFITFVLLSLMFSESVIEKMRKRL